MYDENTVVDPVNDKEFNVKRILSEFCKQNNITAIISLGSEP